MRDTEEMKVWLFDLAHGNLSDDQIVRGFIKHYALNELVVGNVAQDIIFHTVYGKEGAVRAKESLTKALRVFSGVET